MGFRRFDMPREKAEGWHAFHDGLRREQCPYPPRSKEHTEWIKGWDKARDYKDKNEAQRYR